MAQQEMAKWALPMFLVGGFQTIFAGAALIFLVRDVRQARKSTEDGQRAYLMSNYGGHYGIIEGQPVKIAFGIQNVGQTPAAFFAGRIEAHIRALDDPPMRLAPPLIRETGDLLGPSKSNQFRAVASEKLTREQFRAIKSGKMAVFVVGRFRYQDVFKRWFVLEINQRSDPDLSIRGMLAFGHGIHEQEVPRQPAIYRAFQSVWSRMKPSGQHGL